MGKIQSRLFKSNSPSPQDYTPYGADGTPLPYLEVGNKRRYFGDEAPPPPPEPQPERERLDGLRGRQNVIFDQALPAAPGGSDRVREGNFDDWPGAAMGAFSGEQRLQRLRTPTPPARSMPDHRPSVVVPIPPDEQSRLNQLRLPPVQTDNRPRATAPIPPYVAPPATPRVEDGFDVTYSDANREDYSNDLPYTADIPEITGGNRPITNFITGQRGAHVVNQEQQTEPRRRRRRQGPPSTRR